MDPTAMVVDWISRQIYWTELDSGSRNWSVLKLSMDVKDQEPKRTLLARTNGKIRLVEVDPLTSRLIWIQIGVEGAPGRLMTSHVNGSDIRSFFSVDRCPDQDSECRKDMFAGLVTVDWSKEPRIVWISPGSDGADVWSADLNGCHCVREFQSSPSKKIGKLIIIHF